MKTATPLHVLPPETKPESVSKRVQEVVARRWEVWIRAHTSRHTGQRFLQYEILKEYLFSEGSPIPQCFNQRCGKRGIQVLSCGHVARKYICYVGPKGRVKRPKHGAEWRYFLRKTRVKKVLEK